MSRTLVIIMLDFFIMIAIFFFVIQFVQPSDSSEAKAASDLQLVTIVVDRDQFYVKKNLGSVPLSRLVHLGVAAFSDGEEIPADAITVVDTFDGLLVNVSDGREIDRVVIYSKRVLSLEYARTTSTATVSGKRGTGVALLDFLHKPYVDVVLQ